MDRENLTQELLNRIKELEDENKKMTFILSALSEALFLYQTVSIDVNSKLHKSIQEVLK